MIGNDLHRRKFEVVFVSPRSASSASAKQTDSTRPSVDGYEETWLRIDLANDPHKEIEEDIVAELVKRHSDWIAAASSPGKSS